MFVRWCSCQEALLDLILINQDVGIVSDDDDEIVIYGQFDDNFQQLCSFVQQRP